jgi:hypothetical protein
MLTRNQAKLLEKSKRAADLNTDEPKKRREIKSILKK